MARRPMAGFDLDAYVGRSKAVDLSAFAWDDVPRHPVPPEAVRTLRYMQDIESHTIFFYYRQAEIRLRRAAVARVARALVDRFWAPVGSGVQPRRETEFMGRYLFGDRGGRAAARRVDDTMRRLPGFDTVQLLEAWMTRHVGGLNGHRHH